ncbi:unnamed protein product [Choristocarpus tenellus]
MAKTFMVEFHLLLLTFYLFHHIPGILSSFPPHPLIPFIVSRHRQVMPLEDSKPSVAVDAWLAPSAALIGKVEVGSKASIWYGAVIRGDSGGVTIGEETNVQDDVVLSSGDVDIGKGVTIGHGAILKASTVGSGSMIGMKSVLEEATVEAGAIVAAGAIVTPGTVVGAGQVWGGNPAKFLREVSPAEKSQLLKSAVEYVTLSQEHAKVQP